MAGKKFRVFAGATLQTTMLVPLLQAAAVLSAFSDAGGPQRRVLIVPVQGLDALEAMNIEDCELQVHSDGVEETYASTAMQNNTLIVSLAEPRRRFSAACWLTKMLLHAVRWTRRTPSSTAAI
jgi:hypothetical protein